MFMEDLDSPGASLLVERVEGRGAARVTLQEGGSYRFEGPTTFDGSMRDVHEALTRWAFDLGG
jgi:hypothetical protein